MASLCSGLLQRFRHGSVARPVPPDGPYKLRPMGPASQASTNPPDTASDTKALPETHADERASDDRSNPAVATMAELPPDVRDIPDVVRNTVSLDDDPSLPCITFRYFVLVFLFTPPGAVLYTLGNFRTTAPAYPMLFVQIASQYVGLWLQKLLPATTIGLPGTSWRCNLNPGPFNKKEHVLVTLTVASGSAGNIAWVPISLAALFYNTPIPAYVALLFMWAVVFLGFALSALARQFLIYDPAFVWPESLMQVAVFETLHRDAQNSALVRTQKTVFWGAMVVMLLYTFLPEYLFPMLTSLSLLCWVAPRNAVANFVGAGIGGMGFLNLTMDWTNISSLSLTNPMVVPFWTTVVLTTAFVFNCWVLVPAAKWGGLGTWKPRLMSNKVFLANGTVYPTSELMTHDLRFNETAYHMLGPVHMGTQQLWAMFFDYSTYVSALAWLLFFGWDRIRETTRKLRARAHRAPGQSISSVYSDRLNVIQREYSEAPVWWFVALFVATVVTLVGIITAGYMFIPVWTLFVAIATTGIMLIPFAWLYSFSAYQVPIGGFNELIYGYMIHATEGFKHPAGASAYGSIAGSIWYRAQTMLQDQKIGHYMHVPPRQVFFSQIFGQLIGPPLTYLVLHVVIKTKGDFILGKRRDPLNQWTGQSLQNYNSLAVQYVLIGPKRLFEQHMFSPLPYGFLFGLTAPIVLWCMHQRFRAPRFRLWNVTIFSSGMQIFYGNLSTGYISRFVVGYLSMRWFFRNHFELWRRYNFLIAAALDAGCGIALFMIFFIASNHAMPHWWGNSKDSVERCFALDAA